MDGEPRVFAVAGGKGGVGKSVLASSLGIAIARRGQRCVLIDADLGAANLHNLLGIPSPRKTLSDFLDGRISNLSEAISATGQPNLWFVSGARALLEMANPGNPRVLKLARQIRRLDLDCVIVDLGAGTSFNVLDLFLTAPRGLAVTVPEPTAVDNTRHFLKAACYRWLRQAARREPVRSAVRQLVREGSAKRLRSPNELIARVALIDVAAASVLRARAKAFAPLLVVNQAVTWDHRRVGPQLVCDMRDSLGAGLEHLATLARDGFVRDAVSQGRPVLDLHPSSPFSEGVGVLADRLLGAAPAGCRAPAPSAALAPLAEPVAARGPAPRPDLAGPGAYLQACREHLGLGLSELSRRTRIRSLEHIEQERFEALPDEPYVRGFVQQYAAALGLRNGEALTERFLARYREARARPGTGPPPARATLS